MDEFGPRAQIRQRAASRSPPRAKGRQVRVEDLFVRPFCVFPSPLEPDLVAAIKSGATKRSLQLSSVCANLRPAQIIVPAARDVAKSGRLNRDQ